MAETRIIFGPKRTPGSQCHGFLIDIYTRNNDKNEQVLVCGLRKDGRTTQNDHINIPRAALPDLIAALRKIDAGPLEAQLIEMEEKSNVNQTG